MGLMEGWAESTGACVRLGMFWGRRRGVDGWMDFSIESGDMIEVGLGGW